MASGTAKRVAPKAIKAAKERWQAPAALDQGFNQLTAAEALGGNAESAGSAGGAEKTFFLQILLTGRMATELAQMAAAPAVRWGGSGAFWDHAPPPWSQN